MDTDKKFDYFVKKKKLEKEVSDAEHMLAKKKAELEELKMNEADEFYREAKEAYVGNNLIVSRGNGNVLYIYKIQRILSADSDEVRVLPTKVIHEQSLLIGSINIYLVATPGETPIKEGDLVTIVDDERFYEKIKNATDSIARQFEIT